VRPTLQAAHIAVVHDAVAAVWRHLLPADRQALLLLLVKRLR
jgi:hypothetical protein